MNVRQLVKLAMQAGAVGAAQNMIGEAVHALVHQENANQVAEAFKQVLPSEKILMSKIDFQGAVRLVENEEIKKVAVGGTFDELHRGHKALLSKAFEIGEKVVIGLTSDEFVSKMGKAHKTASYAERFKDLGVFLEKSGLAEKAEIVPLNDPYGLTISGTGLDALIVSKETEIIADKINKIRCEAGIAPLKIVTVNMILAENCGPISTTRIRKGEIDRNGHLLQSYQR